MEANRCLKALWQRKYGVWACEVELFVQKKKPGPKRLSKYRNINLHIDATQPPQRPNFKQLWIHAKKKEEVREMTTRYFHRSLSILVEHLYFNNEHNFKTSRRLLGRWLLFCLLFCFERSGRVLQLSHFSHSWSEGEKQKGVLRWRLRPIFLNPGLTLPIIEISESWLREVLQRATGDSVWHQNELAN